MKDFDLGYFGTGDAGYAQYMTAFERNFGTDAGCEPAPDDTDDDATDRDEDF